MKKLQVNETFRELIPPLTAEEYKQLEDNILKEGCREPLVVWEGYIVDGHNRYEICRQHNIEFQTLEKVFEDEESAMDWIDANQLGRRNLTPDQMRLLRGRRYSRFKKPQGGTGANQYVQTDQNDTSATADKLAKEHGVSAPTIKRDGKFYEEVEQLKERYPTQVKSIYSGEQRASKVIRDIRHKERAATMQSAPLPPNKYHVIYCDPPWEYNNSGFQMSAENQYPTMPTEELQNLGVSEITADNAVLFMWATNPLLKDALSVMKSWGFNYKTNMVWVKERHTAGFYVFGQHELLLIGLKGSLLPQGEKPKSIIEGVNNVHSKKPDVVYEVIEVMYPKLKYVELFARNKPREGWDKWGSEVGKFE